MTTVPLSGEVNKAAYAVVNAVLAVALEFNFAEIFSTSLKKLSHWIDSRHRFMDKI
ncbi:hypothetical protein MQ089_04080 [Edwardsiella anguillarum]|uniref:hypothetical protein n=1 Tax=Edwardsiella anguillarum TaxID=1821960 RepID=UPI0024B64A87|nr:hypothetical protein [Edwardsiella anguillarum]WHP81064.1 hypothetical protein MQ090_04060 [Edwardsiella anguillarum]WHQ18565.1 hypothetical protein MQ085_04080 [Edwardsiella anguillarum]WHQ22105.1 hypothetical protein MQ089_04080 [Edwardsiella anguillarum]WHQ25629.1 hypothetical protein MQ094_04080 [Edwardsiella anguillarum]WHQ29151.1 hypothetical protein MQ093_04080 [Edwardsiella anguillarum]